MDHEKRDAPSMTMDEILELNSGLHKDGLGWNAYGVYCGKCSRNTCEGCPNEYVQFKGFSEEALQCIKQEIMEDNL